MPTAAPSKSMLDLLNGFVAELRNAGLPVSLTENLDAMEALRHIPLEDRETFKYALAATLVKNNAHWRSFETVFEVYFSLRGSKYGLDDDSLDPDLAELLDEEGRDGAGDQGQGQSGQGGGDALTPEELRQLLYQAMMKGDEALMRAIAYDQSARLILNVRGGGALTGVDPDAVVEVPCIVTASGPQPIAGATLPAHGVGLVSTVKYVEQQTIEAALTGSKDSALRALAHHPLIDSVRVARALLEDARSSFADLSYLR